MRRVDEFSVEEEFAKPIFNAHNTKIDGHAKAPQLNTFGEHGRDDHARLDLLGDRFGTVCPTFDDIATGGVGIGDQTARRTEKRLRRGQWGPKITLEIPN